MTNQMGPIVITGSSGYIGTYLKKALEEQNVSYIALQRNTSHNDGVEWPTLPNNAHVIHLAGRTDVLESWTDPVGYYEANTNTTLKLLEKCREAQCSITYLSSYSYGAPSYLPIDEKHPLAAVNPYGLSKIAADDLVRFYNANFDITANVIRLFNAYGPNQQDHLLIPTIAKQILDPVATGIHLKDLSPKRDYIYITDVISAILAVVEKGNGDTYNLGYGQSHSVQEIVDLFIKASKRKIDVTSDNAQRQNEIPDVVADITKLQRATGWSPTIDLYTGLSSVLAESKASTKQ